MIGTAGVIVLPLLAVVFLHRLGSYDWLRVDFADLTGWLRRTPIEEALAAILRYVALAGGYWLAASSSLYLIARASGAARLVNATAIFTLPAVRRVTDRLVIGAVAASTIAVPAIAFSGHLLDTPDAVVSLVDPIEARMSATASEDQLSEAAPMADVREPATEDAASPPAAEPAEPDADDSITIVVDEGVAADGFGTRLEVVVREGDHLWSLAETRVVETLGRPVGDHEIAPYWRRVIDSNPHLRSGTPDLIYPGEVVVLPPLP